MRIVQEIDLASSLRVEQWRQECLFAMRKVESKTFNVGTNSGERFESWEVLSMLLWVSAMETYEQVE